MPVPGASCGLAGRALSAAGAGAATTIAVSVGTGGRVARVVRLYTVGAAVLSISAERGIVGRDARSVSPKAAWRLEEVLLMFGRPHTRRLRIVSDDARRMSGRCAEHRKPSLPQG